MKKEQTETTTKYFCDICKREVASYLLSTCPRCEREGCNLCTKEVYDVFHTEICKVCNQIPEVNGFLTKLHKKWLAARKKARAQMKETLPQTGEGN